jgi:cytochrome c553
VGDRITTAARVIVASLALAHWAGGAAPAWAGAGDPDAGRLKARQCQVCHGYDGIGRNPEVPNIAGESVFYLTKQLRAFRSGERVHPQMSIVAKGLTDADIDDLAAYYASIKFTVEPPPK